ncbi:MAG TPA: ThuA domain-containing protein [Planctomycetaceae bacterium]|nr:ThuA domain-containing protein [Planctomycetaceae bacterium]
MKSSRLALVAAALVGLGSVHLAVPTAFQAEEKAGKKARILMVTVAKTFTHDPVKRQKDELAPAEVAVTQLGQTSGLFAVDCTQDPVADLTPDNLKKYDIVFFYTQGPDLGIPEQNMKFFLNTWLKQKGHGFVATHSSTDTYSEYQPYWDMIGGTFNGHPWNSGDTVTISVHDTKHPASKMWGPEFAFKDEIYQYVHWQPEKVRVLMSLNMAKCSLKKPYHVPVSWVKNYGEGKVFYTNLGHNTETWTNKQFIASLLGGIKWVLGLEEGDATPNPDVSQAQEEKAKADAGAAP